MANSDQQPKLFWVSLLECNITTLLFILLAILLPANWYFVSTTLHLAIGILGVSLAIILVALVLALNIDNVHLEYKTSIYMGLISMAILDGFHSLASSNNIFIWLNTMSVFTGGLFSCTIFTPIGKKPLHDNKKILLFPMFISLLVGAFSLRFPSKIPEMLINGKFSLLVIFLNIGGACLFAITSFKLTWLYTINRKFHYKLFATYSSLATAVGLLFSTSVLWDAEWWWWHIVRILSYIVVFAVKITQIRLSEQERKKAIKQLELLNQRNVALADAVLSNTIEGIININERGVIQTFNLAAEKIFGYKTPEVIGKNVTMLMPVPYSNEHDTYLHNYLNTGIPKIIGIGREVQGQRKDGSIFDMELGVSAVTLDNEKIFTGLVRDISERKKIEKARQVAEEQLSIAVKGANVGLWHWNIPINNVYYSDEFKKLLGYEVNDLSIIPQTDWFFSLLHPEDFKPVNDAISAHFDSIGKIPYKIEYKLKHKSGNWRYFLAEGQSSFNKDGQPLEMAGYVIDISDKKEQEELLIQAKETAELSTKIKSEFLAKMSHEIRTPMNGILGITEILLNSEKLSENHRRYVKLIQRSGESLLVIINSILDFSKIEAGKIDLELIPFNLRQQITTALNTIGLVALSKELEFSYTIKPEIPNNLIGDPTRVSQILTNLAGNAIKFTNEGKIIITISLDNVSENHCIIHFEVKDTGIGIAKELIDKILEPFSQAASSTTREYGGTGLGLSISKQLIELMHGNLWIESQEGAGSTFHFTIPFKIGEISKDIDIENLLNIDAIFVDDVATNRAKLETLLSHWKINSYGCSSGQTLLHTLKNNDKNYPLIILDGLLPDTSGAELAKQIRTIPTCKTSKILLLSSQTINNIDINNIDSYLPKPYTPSDLLSKIVELFREDLDLPQDLKITNSFQPHKSFSILLVEDNEINQLVGTKMLNSLGHKVVVAENGQVALETLVKSNFDLIFMDIHMPVMNGWATTTEIRQKEKLTGKHIPIIALTANAIAGDKEKCLQQGMDDYVSKPFRQQELNDVIERIGNKFTNLFKEQILGDTIHRESILHSLDEDEVLLDKTIHSTLEQLPIYINEVWNSLQNKNQKNFVLAAHQLRNSIAIFYTGELYKKCEELESFSIETDLTQIKHCLVEIEDKLPQFKTEIQLLATPVLEEKVPQKTPSLSLTELLERTGGDKTILIKVISVFLNKVNEYLSNIEQAIIEQNSEALMKTAHKLKGSISCLTSNRSVEIALELETLGRNNMTEGAQEIFEKLTQEVLILCSDLKQILEKDLS